MRKKSASRARRVVRPAESVPVEVAASTGRESASAPSAAARLSAAASSRVAESPRVRMVANPASATPPVAPSVLSA
jgi:hypothetical protein